MIWTATQLVLANVSNVHTLLNRSHPNSVSDPMRVPNFELTDAHNAAFIAPCPGPNPTTASVQLPSAVVQYGAAQATASVTFEMTAASGALVLKNAEVHDEHRHI